MFGQGTMGTGIGAMAPATPAATPPVIPTPQPNILSVLMKALNSPGEVAQKMAEVGMTPQDFHAAMQGNNLGATMQATQGAAANAESAFGSDRAKSANQGQQYDIYGPQDSFGQSKQDMFANPNDYHEPATGDKFITLDTLKKLFASETPPKVPSNYLGNNPQMVAGSNTPGAFQPPIAPGPFGGREEVPGALPAAAQQMPIVPQAATGLTGSAPGSLPSVGQQYGPPQGEFGRPTSSVMGGAGGTAPNLTGNAIYDGFMGAVKTKVTNPYGLAAIAATGKSESGFNAGNAFGHWNDVGDTAGGIMSWRGGRFKAMQDFVAAHGGDPNKPDPKLQGEFLLQENPHLIDALNAAKSPEEAQKLMNNAWAFKGYQDSTSGEAARRIALATNMASQFKEGKDPIIKGGEGNNTLANAGASQGVTAGNTATPQSFSSRLSDIAAALQNGGSGDGWGNMDMNLPKAPSPVPPRPGNYQADPVMAKLLLSMLYGGGGPQIPSLGQLI